MSSPADRLAARGLVLPEVTPPLAAYVPAVLTGSYVYTSGQLPMSGGKLLATGKVGAEVSAEEAAELAEIFQEWWRRGIPIGPYGAFVSLRLRDFDQAPFGFIELRMIGLAEERHSDQSAIGAVTPTVIGTCKHGGVAVIVAAHLHASMAA